MAQRVIERTDADAKLKKALLDKEAELRRSLDDADRCSALQYFRAAALATCTAALATCTEQTLHGGRARAVTYNPPVMRHVPTWHTADNGTGPRGCRRRCGAWSKGGRICTGTGLAPPTSALGLGSPLPICTADLGAAPGTWRVAVAG